MTKQIRCDKCGAMVAVRAGVIREHHKPTPLKTWVATHEHGSADTMADVHVLCSWSGARVKFP